MHRTRRTSKRRVTEQIERAGLRNSKGRRDRQRPENERSARETTRAGAAAQDSDNLHQEQGTPLQPQAQEWWVGARNRAENAEERDEGENPRQLEANTHQQRVREQFVQRGDERGASGRQQTAKQGKERREAPRGRGTDSGQKMSGAPTTSGGGGTRFGVCLAWPG